MQRTLFGATVLALGLAAAPRPAHAAHPVHVGPDLTVQAELQQVMDAFRAGEHERVIETAKAVPSDSENYPKALYVLGETYLLVHEPVEAEKAFSNVLEARPRAVPARVGLARALTVQGVYETAEIHLRAALEVEENDMAALRALGELFMADGRMREAREALDVALAIDATHPMNTRASVEWLLRDGDEEAAAAQVATFVEQRPKHPLGPFLQAVVYERTDRDKDAIAAYQKSIELDPKFLDAHKNLAILCHTRNDTYQTKDRTDLALAHYAIYFELGGKDQQLQNAYEQMRQFLTAAAAQEKK